MFDMLKCAGLLLEGVAVYIMPIMQTSSELMGGGGGGAILCVLDCHAQQAAADL